MPRVEIDCPLVLCHKSLRSLLDALVRYEYVGVDYFVGGRALDITCPAIFVKLIAKLLLVNVCLGCLELEALLYHRLFVCHAALDQHRLLHKVTTAGAEQVLGNLELLDDRMHLRAAHLSHFSQKFFLLSKSTRPFEEFLKLSESVDVLSQRFDLQCIELLGLLELLETLDLLCKHLLPLEVFYHALWLSLLLGHADCLF